MRNKMIRVSTKVMAAILVAASVITTTPIAHAEENPAVVEEVQVETEESTVVEETTETEETTEEVEVPVVETTEVEGQGDIIDDEFAVVEGQGDVIDDEFAVVDDATVVEESTVIETTEVEGQGDVIDDEFAYVEGQGDVIDDEFAVSEEEAWEAANEIRTAEMAKFFGEFGTVEMDLQNAEWYQEYQKAQEAKAAEEARLEAEAAVEAAEVAENDTEVAAASVNSFVAVGSVDCADSSEDERTAWKEQTIRDLETKRAYDLNKIPEENKSHLTKSLENFVNGFDLYKDDKKIVCDGIDSQDKFGVAEKEYLKELTKTGYGALNGFVTKEIIPGIGPVKKAAQALESFSKAKDAKGWEATTVNVLEGIKNSAQTVIAIIPGGGGLINSAVDAGISTMKYVGIKLFNLFS